MAGGDGNAARGRHLFFNRFRTRLAALVAFLMGVPLTERALAQPGDIIGASLGLADAIIDSAGES